MIEITYDVFARKNRGEPLRHIGYLEAPGDELARVYAWRTYDEENWFEMCVVRRSDVIPVNRDDGPFARGRRSGRPGRDGEADASTAQPYGGDADAGSRASSPKGEAP